MISIIIKACRELELLLTPFSAASGDESGQKLNISNKPSQLYFDRLFLFTFLALQLSGEEFGVVPPYESHVSGEQRRRG